MQQPPSPFTPDDGGGGDHHEHDQQVFADLFASGDIMRLDPTRSPTNREQQQQQQPSRQVPPLPPRRHASPGRTAPPRRRVSPPEGSQRRRDSSEGPRNSDARGSRGAADEYEYEQEPSGYKHNPLERTGRSSSDQRFDRHSLYETDKYYGQQPQPQQQQQQQHYSRRTSNPNFSSGRSRQSSDGGPSGRYRSGGRYEHRTPIKKRSKSLGERMALAVSTPREPVAPANLLLYHVSKPEPRARWVFNLSKHTNVVDSGPPPTTITSVIDKKRPNLGGLVWVNAVLGNLHCCLQKGVKNKAVTPVPADVLDGWLNGQTGWWWIGALKEGHRALWDSHVVMNWAMVFIPCSPEVAARNNMEVWHDKCLPGSLRVARPGELARKIVDIVTDDQDKEPEQVVHTHLCILLAEGDDLELKRPKMFSKGSSTPRAPVGDAAPALRHSASMTSVDLSQVSLDKDGTAVRVRSSSGDATAVPRGAAEGSAGVDMAPFGSGAGRNILELEEAMEKVAKYRERIVILKEDRRSKKALLDQLRCELEEKEEMFSAENDRLRLERNDIKDRAKSLWVDIENLRREIDDTTAEKNMLRQDAEGLKKQVDRLRRERNSARSDAMRWLEKQREASSPFLLTDGGGEGEGEGSGDANGDANGNANGDAGVFPKTPGKTRALVSRAQSAPGNVTAGAQAEGGKLVSVDYKAAAAIAKLKSKVDRLRRERDQAEAQAAEWLRTEQEKLAAAAATATATGSAPSSASRGEGSGDDSGSGGGGGPSGGSPVVASLRAESLKLQRELRDAKEEAKRLRKKAEAGGGASVTVGAEERSNGTTTVRDPQAGDPHEARLALGRLLGQALNLLDPEAAADAKAAAAASAALSALNDGGGAGAATGDKSKQQQHSEMEMEAVAPETPPEVVDASGAVANGRLKSGPGEVATNRGMAFPGSNPVGDKFGVGPTLVGTTG
ncbi:unnamed protein product [Scytosiphon promiscuus]